MKTPEELLKEIRFLFTKSKKSSYLDTHQKNTAINNTLLAMLKQFDSGKVPSHDYELYKGYMFITLRNEIAQNFLKLKRNINQTAGVDYAEELPMQISKLSAENENENTYNNDLFLIAQALKLLSQRDRAILRWYNRGWKEPTLMIALNANKNITHYNIVRARKRLKEIFIKLKKYQDF